MPSANRIKLALLVVLGLAHLFVTLFAVVPGRLTIDEEVQHWMVRSFALERSLALWNGYDEFPSLELEYHPFIKPHDGRLYPVYPYLFPVLTGPLYLLMGLRGIYVVNSLAFAGTVLLCFLTARRLFRDMDLALNSCLILVLSTFAWEYSHAVWPHATASLFVAGAVYAAACAATSARARNARVAAVVGGLIAGLGCGIRVDVVLVFPALVLPFLFTRPWRPVEALLVLVGAAPGLIILAMTNEVKFGVLSPFSYGARFPAAPKGFILGIVAGAAALWLVTRIRFTAMMPHSRRLLWIFAAVVSAALLIVPELRALVARVLRYGYISLVDFRALEATAPFSAMKRIPGGGVVYVDSLKKAVLQSMPFLPLLLVPLVASLRNDREARGLWLLFLVPLAVAGYGAYEFPRQEGAGLTFNYRYFVSALPCVAILCAFALSRLRTLWPVQLTWTTIALTCVLAAGGFAWLVLRPGTTVVHHEFPLLAMPLVLAGMLLVLLAGSLVFESFCIRPVQVAGRIVVTAALVWAGLTAFSYDYVRHRGIRATDAEYGRMIADLIPDDSILFVARSQTPYSSMVLERNKVRLAIPQRDGFQDFPALVEFHLRAGRRVFAFFPKQFWLKLVEGPLSQYTIRPVMPFAQEFVGEITARIEPPAPGR